MSLLRTRWAAIGAAVAVALGGGGVGLVSATTPSDAVTFVPITPCRVADTRADPVFNVGPKTTPLGPEEEHAITAVGNSGNCTEVPADATAVSLNVTALDATLPTFLAVYATGEPTPDSSNLNPQPGAPPTPNAVTTELSAIGRFTIFNKQGSVDVLADIVGYYVDHHHDERYYTEHEVDDAIATHDHDDRYRTAAQSDLDWLIVSGTSVRASSPELAGMTIFRPPSVSEGIRCLVFPDGLSVERNAIVGTIEDGVSGVQDWGLAINSTVNTLCSENNAQWDIAVTTTRTIDVAGTATPVHDDAIFRLLIPRRRPFPTP